ncbi:MAG: type II toxin-antitoxin system VapC family toxin, partial [Nitrososphaerales archaeon]
MRFLDSNIFVYAFYKSKRELSASEKSMKDFSKKIVTNSENGSEKVLTTIVHLSEVVNITKYS